MKTTLTKLLVVNFGKEKIVIDNCKMLFILIGEVPELISSKYAQKQIIEPFKEEILKLIEQKFIYEEIYQ